MSLVTNNATNEYIERPLHPGMGQAVAERTILRKKDDGSFETWSDVAARVAKGNALLCPDESDRPAEEAVLRKHIAQASLLMSGRHLQHGDEDQPTRNQEIFTNCLHGSTKLPTMEYGTVAIESIANQSVTVIAADGVPRIAKINAHGQQMVYEYTFKQDTSGAGKLRHTVMATKNHRWFLKDGSVTTELAVGDKIKTSPTTTDRDPIAVVHGIIFGDGSAHKSRIDTTRTVSQGRTYVAIRVCKQDTVRETIHEILDDAGFPYTTPPHADGDRVYYLGKQPHFKEVPFCNDPAYIRGFIHGWWLADGYKGIEHALEISTSNTHAVQWLMDYACIAGYAVTMHRVQERKEGDGSYANGKPLHSIRIRDDKGWVVTDITEVGTSAVYCPEEPVTSGFVLANGLLTGNCATSPTSFLMFYLLLNGSGVGRSYDDLMMLTDWDNAPNIRTVLDETHADFDISAHESVRDAKHKYGGDSKSVMWFEVPDSREGWAKSLEMWELAAFEKIHKDKMLILDFSKVRCSGSPIGGMQNRPASGPVALMNAFNKAASIKGAGLEPWRQAIYVDHYFAECVLVGGARRSARMSTKFWKDTNTLDFIEIKRPIEYAGMSPEEVGEYRTDLQSPPTSFLWSSNNSVTVDAEFWALLDIKRGDKKYTTDIAKHARKIWKSIVDCSYGDGTGEPGIINVDKLVRNDEGWDDLNRGDYVGYPKYRLQEETEIMMSRLAKRAKRMKYNMITNPCLTADTPVWVADGRTSVTIGELAEEGKDVPVFCYDKGSDEVTVRTMRNPRVTGHSQKILKVTLDNGQSIRCTENHKFLTRDKTYTRADELQQGDSLFVTNRYESTPNAGSDDSRTDVYGMIGYQNTMSYEHILVAKQKYHLDDLSGYHVHHINGNKTDNRPENLELKEAIQHLSDHSSEVANPSYAGITHDELLIAVIAETKRIGHRMSTTGYGEFAKTHGYPQSFSGWRDNHFGGVSGMLAHAAVAADLDPVMARSDVDPRTLRMYKKLATQGYDVALTETNDVIIHKKCECCGNPMDVNGHTPEVGLCSQSCKNKQRDDNTSHHLQNADTQTIALANRKVVLNKRKAATRGQQLSAFTDLQFNLSRKPKIGEFKSFCKEQGISSEVGRPTSPFPLWSELVSHAADHNHKVVSVEHDGYEDVYNGTVDDHHNFFVGGFNETTKNGRPKTVWVNNINCGEIALNVLGGYCVIADVVPFHAETLDEAEEAFRVATRSLMRVNLMDSLYRREVLRTNRIGVGMTGVHEFAWKFFEVGFIDLVNPDFDGILEILRNGSSIDDAISSTNSNIRAAAFWITLNRFNVAVHDEAVMYAKKLGQVVPHTEMTIKPAGTTSKLFGLTEGWHLPSMEFYLRWVQFRHDDPLVDAYRAEGYPTRELEQYSGTTIVGFPTSPAIATLGLGDNFMAAGDATPADQYRWLMLGEKFFIHGVDLETLEDRTDRNTGNQISYCLAGDGHHLIATDVGMMHIENMTVSKTVDRDGVIQNVVDVVDNGVKPTIIMQLQNGSKITATANHRVLILDDTHTKVWKHMHEIEVGDTVVRRIGDNVWSSTNAALPKCDQTRNETVAVPHEMSDRMGLFLGMLMSDGHIGKNGIGITSANMDVVLRFETLVRNLFGLSMAYSADSRYANIICGNVNSRGLSRWLELIVGTNNHDHNRVPDCVLRSTKSVIEQFIKGYTLDGYVNQKGWVHICTTVSENMATDLQSVLFNLGYDGYVDRALQQRDTGCSGAGKAQYVVYLDTSDSSRFNTDIGFIEQHKTDAVAKNAIEPPTDRLGDSNTRFTQVVDIFTGPTVETFDITVAESHEYVANSVIVHNTLKYKPEVTDLKHFRDMMREFQPLIRACSVMPQEDTSSYEYLPEETVTKAEYEAMVRAINTQLEEDIGAEHVLCEGGACPVDFSSGNKSDI